MLGVVLLGDLDGQRAQLGGDQAEALGLEAGDDLADQATGDTIGLDQDERTFSGGCRHGRERTSTRMSTLVDSIVSSTYVDVMASPTDVTTAAAADDPDTGLRAIRALRDLADRLEVLQVATPGPAAGPGSRSPTPSASASRPSTRSTPPREGTADVFERFTVEARQAVVSAQEEAGALGPSGSSRCTCCSRSPVDGPGGSTLRTAGVDHERLLAAVRAAAARWTATRSRPSASTWPQSAPPPTRRSGPAPWTARPAPRTGTSRSPTAASRCSSRPCGWSGGARCAGSTRARALRRALDRGPGGRPRAAPAGHRPRRAPRPGGRLRATAGQVQPGHVPPELLVTVAEPVPAVVAAPACS